MKKILISLLLVFVLVSSSAFAEVSDITSDAVFTAFNSDADSSLEGWKGYTKNGDGTIDEQSWFTFKATKRIVGNVIANMPESMQETTVSSPTGSVFYTGQNFGSEYNFSGDFYNFQNQSYVYFNAAFSEKDGRTLATAGYRISADRSGKRVELQKTNGSSWITLVGEDTGAWGWVLCHFDITFADGVIKARITHSDKYDITLEYDVSGDADYVDTGYIGFGSASAKITVGKINVNYNSSKVYSIPELRDVSRVFKGYTVLPAAEKNEFGLWIDAADEADVKKCSLYIDNAFVQDMTADGDYFSASPVIADKGTHTAKVILSDRYGNEAELVSTIFFVADFAAYPAVFTDAEGNAVESPDGSAVNVSFSFNPCNRNFDSVTLYAVKYDENGKMIKIYSNKVTDLEANTESEISAAIDSVAYGESVTAFLFESFAKPSPLSGGYTFE